ncbi:MAG: LPS export ABC transporter permease LptG, partial [Gallionellaceae bacterium]|nr:LPS export ABC transporter permease LptG [Gallionellaceae bacterium]
MNLLTRHLAREIYAGIALVFVALMMLFSFLDLIRELGSMGRGDYNFGYVMLYILMTMPGNIYEIFPVAILIGSIFALVHMAANSELVVFRTSGASLWLLARTLFKIGIPLVLLSYLCGEVLAPVSEQAAKNLRLRAQHAEVTMKGFRSGVWVKDKNSFVNAKRMMPDSSLEEVSIYDFDNEYDLNAITSAKRAVFLDDDRWQLEGVGMTRFNEQGTAVESRDKMEWNSTLNPTLLSVLLVNPRQMSAWDLYLYVQHLRDSRQQTVKYEIALWSKLLYPFIVMVMLLLALPFAVHNRRTGGVSDKVFAGIVLGLSFYFLNSLFGSLGTLNNWQPFAS